VSYKKITFDPGRLRACTLDFPSAAGDLSSMGKPDFTVLSFATIGHVGRNLPKWISATGTWAGMGSSISSFVPGSEQPPTKSGRDRA
jgi:hypothetical protein